jgi:coproporphyrinogen III oxidase
MPHSVCTMRALFETRQHNICDALSAVAPFDNRVDTWSRERGGGGCTRVVRNDVFESGGVAVSTVHGQISASEAPLFETLIHRVNSRFDITADAFFYATGISLIIHPKNPFVPTVHANYRYFEVTCGGKSVWWVGGGADLTPYYITDDDARHFHGCHKAICDNHPAFLYKTLKADCDTYFYLPHRQEHRGIGGIFFDYRCHDFDDAYAFITGASAAFIDAYIPIVNRQKDAPVLDAHRQWQQLRRGRYVEFNLLYDRGTLFGLKTGGRTESILMSLPPSVSWNCDMPIEPDSAEAYVVTVLKKPIEWV